MAHLDDMPRRGGAVKKWTVRAIVLVAAIVAAKLALVGLIAVHLIAK